MAAQSTAVDDQRHPADASGVVGQSPAGRARRRRLIGPLSSIAVIAGATTVLAVVNPNEPGHYPGCPTQEIFGFDCPGCGGLRATHDLAHGDLAGAFGHNALFVVLVPVIVFILGRAVVAAWTGRVPRALSPQVSRWLLGVLVTVMIVFTVVRNLPVGAYFGSG